MRFKVKKNPFLVGLTVCLIPILFFIPIVSIIIGEGIFICLIVFIFTSPIVCMLVWALFHSYHEMNDTMFQSFFGFIKIQIPLHEINKVGYTFNPISSPSWTFKRLKIEYKRYYFVLLSLPKDEESFFNELQKRCPTAEFINFKGVVI